MDPSPTLDRCQCLRRAIASVNASEVIALVGQHPNWPTWEVDGFTAWTRVLVDKKSKRRDLLEILIGAGLDLNAPVVFRGVVRTPLELALQHGRYGVVDRLLRWGVRANTCQKNASILDQLWELQVKTPTDLAGIPLSGQKFGWVDGQVLAHWADKLRANGARWSTKFLARCLAMAEDPASPFRAYARQMMALNAWPAVMPQREAMALKFSLATEYQLPKVYLLARLALRVRPEDNEPFEWLEKALRAGRPSPWLLVAATDLESKPHPETLSRYLSVVQKALESHGMNGWEEPTWGLPNLEGHFKGNVLKVVEKPRNTPVALLRRREEMDLRWSVLAWALERGLPKSWIATTQYPSYSLVGAFLSGHARPERNLDMLECLVGMGVGLGAPLLAVQPTHNRLNHPIPPLSALQFLQEKNPGFWVQDSFRDQAMFLQAAQHGARLDARLPKTTQPGQRPRF